MFIYISGAVRVADILEEFGLDDVPAGKDYTRDDRIDFDDIEVDEQIALGEFPEIEDESLSEKLNQDTIIELSAAIRRGDMTDAEHALDRLFAEDSTIAEWVQRARYSGLARAA